MIIGIGNDLMDTRRMAQALARFGDRFKNRSFTAQERALATYREKSGTEIGTYAKRFAAKEACAKALGTGFSRGVFMKDIGVVNDGGGRPTLHLSGGAKARLDALIPAGMVPVIHVTLTDEKDMAEAFVMIEARAA